jgi:hypothetical protein
MKTFSLLLFSLIGLIACDKDIDYLSQHPVNIAQDKTIDEHVEFLLNTAKQ